MAVKSAGSNKKDSMNQKDVVLKLVQKGKAAGSFKLFRYL